MNYIYNYYKLAKDYFYPKENTSLNEEYFLEPTKQNNNIVKIANICSDYIWTSISSLWKPKLHTIFDSSIEFITYNNECSVCLVTQKEVALIPCGHTFCRKCLTKIDKCPECRGHINGHLRIFV